jgi:tetratricopeptide (TPR) repeat protein
MNRKIIIGLIAFMALGAIIIATYWARPYIKKARISRLEQKAETEISRGDFIDAEIVLRKALAIDPGNADIHFKLGRVLESEGVLAEAKENYLMASQSKMSPEPGYKAGLMAIMLGNPEEAEQIFNENILQWPEHIPTLYQLGYLLAKKGEYEEAIEHFEKIIIIAPNEAEAYNNIGYCFYNLEQKEKARDMFKKALELKPDFESAKKSLESVEEDLQESGASPSGNKIK